jgi:glycosyltransferase involved in cell wall biosynthesis
MAEFEAEEHTIEFEKGAPTEEGATVVVSLYNYQAYIAGALDSVAAQTLRPLSIVVVDDRSKDNSVDVCRAWMSRNHARFVWVALAQQTTNKGLARTRNLGFCLSATEYVFVLDADNQIYPRCIERCLEALQNSDAAFAYPISEIFGGHKGLQGKDPWSRDKLALGNYIDAMALLKKSRWREAGGYEIMPIPGWEDYDLWCKFSERGWWGLRIPEILARYRVHDDSMLRTTTNKREHIDILVPLMGKRHPWLKLA